MQKVTQDILNLVCNDAQLFLLEETKHSFVLKIFSKVQALGKSIFDFVFADVYISMNLTS